MNHPLSNKTFMISQLLILIFGIAFISGLYYLLNIQYQANPQPFLAGPITNSPKSLSLEVTDPNDDNLVFKSNLLLSGKTLPSLKILISSNQKDQVTTSSSDGSFSSSLILNEGPNKISVTVFSATGEEKTVVKNIYYSTEQI